MKRILASLFVLLSLPACAQAPRDRPIVSQAGNFRVTTFAKGLEHPWGAAFLPDGRLLVTERPGRLRVVDAEGWLSAPIENLPAVHARGQGGLLDVALAPDFASTREIWLCHAALTEAGALTRFTRARLSADARGLENPVTVLDATPAQQQGRNHYGCRIALTPDNRHVFLSTGERYARDRAQSLSDLAGKVLRLTREGRVPADNPFVATAGARPEIYSLGHRNPQGLAIAPNGDVIEAEFGARGGDELNRILPGRNYGWPRVTHSVDYNGSTISPLRTAPGFEDPLRFWVPSVNPSGIAFYRGDAFPNWRGSLFIAALSGQLIRIAPDGAEERLIPRSPRLRHVVISPAGIPYLLTDDSEGEILRLDPA